MCEMNIQAEAHSETDNDPKKLLQCILELSRQLEYATTKCDSLESLFASELMVRRSKLKSLCFKLLIEHPNKYSLQTRDRFWRSTCYDVMSRIKRLKKPDKSWTPSQLWYIRSHLISGVGHVSSLLLKIQELPEFQNFNCRYFNSGVLKIRPQFERLRIEGCSNSGTGGKWLEELFYYSLLNIGDLYRYFTEIYYSVDDQLYWHYYNLAQDNYSKAFFLNTDYGMAHNQLGNLSLRVNGGLDSLYYLLYSLSSPLPYEGAYANLRQFLDKQLVEFATAPAAVEWKPLDAFAHSFLQVVYQSVFDSTRVNNFEKTCQETLHAFSQVLLNGDPDLDTNVYFRVSLTTIMTVWRLQSNDSTNVSTAVALAMGIFFQLTDRLLGILNAHSHAEAPKLLSVTTKTCNEEKELEITLLTTTEPERKKSIEVEDRVCELASKSCTVNEMEINVNDAELIVPVKDKSIPPIRRRRRIRRALSSSDGGINYSSDEDCEGDSAPTYRVPKTIVHGRSDGEDSQTDESDFDSFENWTDGDSDSGRSFGEVESRKSKSSLSQNEHRAFEDSSSSSNGLSDSPPNDLQKNVDELISESGQLNNLRWNNPGVESSVEFVVDSEELMQCWTQVEPFLVALLPYMRWIQTTPLISDVFAGSCEKAFLAKLCKIMNLLKSINWDKPYVDILGETNKVSDTFRAEWNALLKSNDESRGEIQQRFPHEMPEDRSLLGLKQFKNTISDLNQNQELLKGEMMMTRVARILSFGYWLSESNSFGLLYSKLKNGFIVPTPQDLRRHLQEIRQDQLRNNLQGAPCKELDKLTQLWKTANPDFHGRNRRAHGRNNRGGNRRRGMRNSMDGFIFVFVDLPAVLNHFGAVRHLATHPKFVIVLPHSVSKTLDIMKETEVEGSPEARLASRWLERAGAKGYNEVRTQREHEKTKISTTYPAEFSNESWEFFDVLENCNFLRTQELKGGGRPAEKFFGDVRDKYRILYLTGHVKILESPTEFDFNPVDAARVTNVFVDKVTAYGRRYGIRRRRNGKSNG